MTSAAGKCLRKMDLPLAGREPSPPYRLRKALCLARQCPIALLNPCPGRPPGAQATRARFEIVGRTHRRESTPVLGASPFATAPGISREREQFHCRLAAASAV